MRKKLLFASLLVVFVGCSFQEPTEVLEKQSSSLKSRLFWGLEGRWSGNSEDGGGNFITLTLSANGSGAVTYKYKYAPYVGVVCENTLSFDSYNTWKKEYTFKESKISGPCSPGYVRLEKLANGSLKYAWLNSSKQMAGGISVLSKAP